LAGPAFAGSGACGSCEEAPGSAGSILRDTLAGMRLPRSFLDRLIPAVGAFAFRALSLTLRHRVENAEQIEALRASGQPFILASQHGRLLLGVIYFRRFRPVIAVSQSRDGDRIARIVERLGWEPARGSSSRGGVRALLALVREVSRGRVAAHIIDGPKGPAGEIKPGLMLLAQRSGAPIVFVYIAARPRLRMPSWDRMQIPLPFARVHIRLSDPVSVPKDLAEEQVESLRLQLQKQLAQGLAQADVRVHGARAQ